jgi:methionine-S-sulfoxide reductase
MPDRNINEFQKGLLMAENKKNELATFAGGCFWCMQGPFDFLEGVISTKAGYIGGSKEKPTYEEVSEGKTGHTEAVEVEYDPEKISYERLLETFWQNIDPTTKNQQFADKGTQYRTAIFYHTEEQRNLAVLSKKKLEESGKFDKPVVTEIAPASKFYPAEDYHQDYYKKNPFHYESYKRGSGRKTFIEKKWGT